MKYDPNEHHRRSIRLRNYDYSLPGAYFVTICAQGKVHVFGEVVEGEMKANEYGRTVTLYGNALPRCYPNIELDAFAVMPNHIHGIICIGGTACEPQGATVGAIHELPLHRRKMALAKIVGYFKMNTAKRVNELRNTPGQPLRQRNYYEHIIRNDDELNKIREYISTNPLRWGTDPENVLLLRPGNS